MGADTSKVTGDPKAIKREELNSLSNLNPNYILKLKERFEQNSEDYSLDKQALQTYFKCRPKEIDVLFEMFDLDQSGTIDSYELVCALAMLSHSTLDEKADLIFNLYDFDRSKSISKDELTVLMTNVISSLKAMEGKSAPLISEVELKTNELFAKADTNKDNSIQLKEFKDYIKTDKQILSCLMSYGIAKSEDLGTQFGTDANGVPELDPDLDKEVKSMNNEVSEKKANMKAGIDFKPAGEFDSGIAKGDQFMAVKPWIGTLKAMTPTGFKPAKGDGVAPNASLQLEYVYGYRCHDARSNLRYSASGKVVYHTAGVGVVLDPVANTQQHFMSHNDDILAIAMHPNGKFVATGQIGVKPKICVWDVDTMQEIVMFAAPLTKGIKNLCFSNDGKYLSASAMDDEHFIAIYDWQAKPKVGASLAPIAHGKGSRAVLFNLTFNPTGDTLISMGVKEVNFHTFANGVITTKKGTGWGVSASEGPQTILSSAFVGTTLFTGSFTGEIASWTGTAKGKGVKAHTGKVSSLYSKPGTSLLLSGGQDGLIISWTVTGTALTMKQQWDIKGIEIGSAMAQVISVHEGAQGKLLVGTRGSEIIEFTGVTPKMLMKGHFESELWGLACHPNQAKVYTYGRDGMLAVWDCKTRRQECYSKLDCPGDAIAFSNKGQYIAMGMNNGTFIVLTPDFKPFVKRGNRNGVAIQVMKFSPDDSLLAVGAHDSMVFTYDVVNKFAPKHKMRGNSSAITHIDFSLNGQYLMTNSLSYEILFYSTQTGKQETRGGSMLKDEQWATWSCTLGFPVMGIFPPAADGSDINAVARSPDGTVSATADDFGQVKLFKYPCPVEEAAFQKYNGHSSHVTNVEFTKGAGQGYLISTGGEDKSVFQWKFINGPAEKIPVVQKAQTIKVDEAGFSDEFGQGDQAMYEEDYGEEEQDQEDQQDKGEFGDDIEAAGDQAMAIYPAKGQILKSIPTGFKETRASGQAPNASLELKWAHGFRSWDTRGNLKYTASGDVVFTTAGVGVVYNKLQNKQSFFTLHGEDIVSMAIHPDGDIIATGQMAGKGLVGPASNKRNFQGAKGRVALAEGKLVAIYIWRASTLQVIQKIEGFHRRALRHLKFSPNGRFLLSIGEDDQNSVAIYDWANNVMVCSSKISPGKLYDPKSKIDQAKVFDANWKTDSEFAACGPDFVKMFTIQGSNCNAAQGQMSAAGFVPQTSCNYVLNGVLITGSAQGDLFKWTGTTPAKPVKGHADAIWQVVPHTATAFFTGGNDGIIQQWSATLTVTAKIDLTLACPEANGLRSLCVAKEGHLLVGTRGAQVVEVDMQGKLKKSIVQGHYKGVPAFDEVWGCATHPKEQKFVTCGADRRIRLWDPTKQLKASELFEFDVTALDWSSDGTFLAVGDRKGNAKLVDANTLQVLGTLAAFNAGGKQPWVEDIKISPDCQYIAFGTHDGCSRLEVGKVNMKAAVGQRLTKHSSSDLGLSSALTHLDWSLDSQLVQINSQACELMFITATTNPAKQVTASSAKDVQWSTYSVIHGYASQGIWPGVDYTDVNSIDRSKDGTTLVTGDDFGKVKLFKFPCTVPKAQSNEYLGHSSHVTKVKFTANDTLVISTGGGDKTVMVWDTTLNNDSEFDKQAGILQSVGHEQEVEIDPNLLDQRVDKSKAQKQALKDQRIKEEQAALAEYKIQVGDDFGNEFGEDLHAEGDQFMAVKPFVGQIKAPTSYTGKPARNQNLPPKVTIELEWVHGYRGGNNRNNMGLIKDGSLAYYAAAVGIVYDPVQHKQRFFVGQHTDDITCVAFSPDGQHVATGEMGARDVVKRQPGQRAGQKAMTNVYIWDALTMQMKFKLSGNGIEKTIIAIAYSPDGSLLGICDQAADGGHNLAVYNTANGICVAKGIGHKGGGSNLGAKGRTAVVEEKGKFITMAFKNNTQFVCIGPAIYKEFTISGANITAKLGQFGTANQLIVSLAVNGQNYLTGAASGELHQWNGTTITGKPVKNHTSVVDAITVTPTHVFTGGRDNKINVLDAKTMMLLFPIDCTTFPDSVSCSPRAIAISGTNLYVGTFGSEIWKMQINIATKKALSPQVMIQGHYSPLRADNNEAWGLSVFKDKTQYVTVSDDSTLRIWDSTTHKQLKWVNLKLNAQGAPLPNNPTTNEAPHAAQGRSVDVNPKGDKIAVGMRDGTLRVYSYTQQKITLTYSKNISKEWIEDLKFSPDGTKLAVGSHDNFIYVFDVLNAAMTFKKMGASSSFITHLDWSIDSQSIRTNDGSYELLYYDVITGKQLTTGASQFRDEPWATNSCALSWPTQGVWAPGQDGSDINHCDRSNGPVIDGMQLVATADDNSKLNIYRYPSPEGADALKLTAHSSHVTKVRWSSQDNFIFTLGGNDTTTMQWRVTKQ